MMRLYHREHAGRPIRVAWMLEELGEPYEITMMTREEAKGEEHRARHPLGRVPVLEDEEGFVFESAAICLHLADLNPDAGLAPAPGTHERALLYQWTIFAPAELEPPLRLDECGVIRPGSGGSTFASSRLFAPPTARGAALGSCNDRVLRLGPDRGCLGKLNVGARRSWSWTARPMPPYPCLGPLRPKSGNSSLRGLAPELPPEPAPCQIRDVCPRCRCRL